MSNKKTDFEVLKWKFAILTYIIITILLVFKTKDLNNKIEDLEKHQLEVNEYILNRIGG